MRDRIPTVQQGIDADVRRSLEQNLGSGAEVGVSLAVDIDGDLLVDLCGGFRDSARTVRWTEDTITNIWSSTKTLTSLAALMLVDRGDLDVYAPVADYCPPGTASGYHALNFGHLIGEVVHRVSGKTLKQFVDSEIAGPLGADLQIGARERDWDRIAEVVPPAAPPIDLTALDPDSPLAKTLTGPGPGPAAESANTAAWRQADIGGVNGHERTPSRAPTDHGFMRPVWCGLSTAGCAGTGSAGARCCAGAARVSASTTACAAAPGGSATARAPRRAGTTRTIPGDTRCWISAACAGPGTDAWIQTGAVCPSRAGARRIITGMVSDAVGAEIVLQDLQCVGPVFHHIPRRRVIASVGIPTMSVMASLQLPGARVVTNEAEQILLVSTVCVEGHRRY